MARNTILTGRTIFASLLAIGAAGSVQAQVVGNVVGGGSATITGGDDMQITVCHEHTDSDGSVELCER